MSKARSLNLWRKDGPEPIDYNKHPDPLHEVNPYLGCLEREKLVKTLTQFLLRWLENPKSFPLESGLAKEKEAWVKAGGEMRVYDGAMVAAYAESGYYKKMLKI